MRGFVACVFVLNIVSCCGQFEKNICVGNTDIAFSTVPNNFNGARTYCRRFGGDLVKIGSAGIQNAIVNALRQSKVRLNYYIGAYDSAGDNKYFWLVDNTAVPKNPKLKWPGPSSGYQNWRSNQPSQKIQKCVVASSNALRTWYDVSCTTKNRYICQKVTVDSAPAIQSIKNNKCNGSLFVNWKPNRAAVGYNHRFTANGQIITGVIPNSMHSRSTEIPGLEILTNYTVQIQVPELQNSCNTSFSVESSGITSGVTDPVTSAILRNSSGCTATWITSDDSATYTIKTKCTFGKYREDEEIQTLSKKLQNWNYTAFQFQPGPNRKCSATIWAKGCGKISTPVKATGICVTPPTEPEKIKRPVIESNGTFKTIKLPKPSEDNGLISCIFVVLCFHNCSESETQFTVQDLEKASQVDVHNNTELANAIALAISVSTISGNQISRKLFQGDVTRCNLYNTGLIAATTSKIIKGKNHISNIIKNVWAFVVTSTPSGSKILLQSSSPIVVLRGDRTTLESGSKGCGATDKGLIAGVIIGQIAVIIAIVAGVVIVRRRQTGTQNDSANSTTKHIRDRNIFPMSQVQEDTSPYTYENNEFALEYKEIKTSGGSENRSQPREQKSKSFTEEYTSSYDNTTTYENIPSSPAYEEI